MSVVQFNQTQEGGIPGRILRMRLVWSGRVERFVMGADFSASGGGGVSLPEVDVEEEVIRDVPWNVVVHNDPVNLMSYVTRVFQKVFGFTVERAERHMLEVHHKGRSVVWTGEREKAELYVQQLHAFLLLATMEKSV